MVTTAIAWVAGIALVAMGANRARFERLLTSATSSQVDEHGRVHQRSSSERRFLGVCRMSALVVGALCIAVGVAGTWSLAVR